jgi:hypothetical protein
MKLALEMLLVLLTTRKAEDVNVITSGESKISNANVPSATENDRSEAQTVQTKMPFVTVEDSNLRDVNVVPAGLNIEKRMERKTAS